MVERITPGPGQESVWDYPRPPRLELAGRTLRIEVGDRVLAETTRGLRVLETSHPPTYYFPPEDVDESLLVQIERTTFCEWKGSAAYVDVLVGEVRRPGAGWRYLRPTPDFQALTGHYAFYAQMMDACFVDGERAEPQPGEFYGGWVTSHVVGPFKGIPGSRGW